VIKLVSITLSFLTLLQSFGLHFDDIAQLDEFVEHAKFHSEQYGDNVFVFIAKHYGELKAEHEKEHQEEKEEHEELPFKHHCHIATVTVYDVCIYSIDITTLEFLEFSSDNFYYQDLFSSLYSKGILQPPRFS
jgi:hypothetical protein